MSQLKTRLRRRTPPPLLRTTIMKRRWSQLERLTRTTLETPSSVGQSPPREAQEGSALIRASKVAIQVDSVRIESEERRATPFSSIPLR